MNLNLDFNFSQLYFTSMYAFVLGTFLVPMGEKEGIRVPELKL